MTNDFGDDDVRRFLDDLTRPPAPGRGPVPPTTRQTQAAARLGLSREAFVSRLHRLREDWRKALTAAITPTVTTPGDVEDELRYLCEVLRG